MDFLDHPDGGETESRARRKSSQDEFKFLTEEADRRPENGCQKQILPNLTPLTTAEARLKDGRTNSIRLPCNETVAGSSVFVAKFSEGRPLPAAHGRRGNAAGEIHPLAAYDLHHIGPI